MMFSRNAIAALAALAGSSLLLASAAALGDEGRLDDPRRHLSGRRTRRRRKGKSGKSKKAKMGKFGKASTEICLVTGEVFTIEGTDEEQTGPGQVNPECNYFGDALAGGVGDFDAHDCDFYYEPFFFNRDVTSSFKFEDFKDGSRDYSFTKPPIGTGALCATATDTAASADKLIIEYYGDLEEVLEDIEAGETSTDGLDLYEEPLENLESMKYSFWVENCDPTDEGITECGNQFYLNVFMRPTNYDPLTESATYLYCNLSYGPDDNVPMSVDGNEGSWTTVDLVDIKNLPGIVCPGSALGCNCRGATTINEYIAEVESDFPGQGLVPLMSDSIGRAFQLNMGQSTSRAISGCYDNIQFKLSSEDSVRVYDLEAQ